MSPAFFIFTDMYPDHFRTTISVKPSDYKISHADSFITIGSCFSNVIGHFLQSNKFDVLNNPFGTTYHPLAITKLLNYSLYNTPPTDNGFIENENIHYHLDFHSSLGDVSKNNCLKNITEKIEESHGYLKKKTTLIITLGTSFIYNYIKTNQTVANCHKLPAKEFTRTLSNPEEIIAQTSGMISNLLTHYPDLKIILTVSPVRHTKDTIQLNSVSKAILRLVCHELEQSFEQVSYFPSFEIMMDDLRDYRFYKDDFIHPTKIAEDYIINIFSETYFTEEIIRITKEWQKVIKALHHSPKHRESEGFKLFLQQTSQKIKGFENHFDVSDELKILEKRFNETIT
ncbi:MAG: GSCFA domain-containing protein [Cyclobacteriaceae bacterium]|nr:GSCFA domain-containing protein [Cyclobacteriaceae bacterium]